MNNRQLYMGLALLAATGTASAGCATRGDLNALKQDYVQQLRTLRTENEKLRTEHLNLAALVQKYASTPLADQGKEFYLGQGLDKEVGMLIGVALKQFKDPKSIAEAKEDANGLAIIPVPQQDVYFVVLKYDDGDKKSTEGPDSKDRTIVDRVGGEVVYGYPVKGSDVPKKIKDKLLNVNPYTPPAVTPVVPKGSEKKPFIRRQQAYIRPQVGYRARGRI